MRKILVNKIRCKKCGDIIESKSVHDFKFCKCESVAVDGGHDYLRRLGELEDWEDLSEYELEGEMTILGEYDSGFEEACEKSEKKYQEWKRQRIEVPSWNLKAWSDRRHR